MKVAVSFFPSSITNSLLPLENSFPLTSVNEIKAKGIFNSVPTTVNAAIFATYTANENALEDVCFYIENNLSDIIQLPELFFVSDKSTINKVESRKEIEKLSQIVIEKVSAELRPFQYVCTSLIINGQHKAVIISNKGLYASQQQLAVCQRYHWDTCAQSLNIIELTLEQGAINVAMLTADDALESNLVKTAVDNNIHALLVPFDIQQADEVEQYLTRNAYEYGICVIAATREKSFEHLVDEPLNANEKIKTKKSTGFIINLPTEAVMKSLAKSRSFSGDVSQPIVKHQHGKITKALINPNVRVLNN